jgi:hypothetical protein
MGFFIFYGCRTLVLSIARANSYWERPRESAARNIGLHATRRARAAGIQDPCPSGDLPDHRLSAQA